MSQIYRSACALVLLIGWSLPCLAQADWDHPTVTEVAIFFAEQSAKPPHKILRSFLKQTPSPLSLVADDAAPAEGTLLSYRYSIPDDYSFPDSELLVRLGRDVDADDAHLAQTTEHIFTLSLHHRRSDARLSYRQLCEVVGHLTRGAAAVIWDDTTKELLSPQAWQERRVDSWTNGVPYVPHHVVLAVYPQGEGLRAVSRGLRKFGAPDVSVERFAKSYARQMQWLTQAAAQVLVERNIVRQLPFLPLSFGEIRSQRLRDLLRDSLFADAEEDLLLSFAAGRHQEGDPDNLLLVLTFDQQPGDSLQARQLALLSQAFGSEDTVRAAAISVLEEAAARAQAQLPELAKIFRAGLSVDERILIKAPFVRHEAQQREWMWVEVVAWQDGQIHGLLNNQPSLIEDLNAGDSVALDESEVADFIHYRADGEEWGHFFLQVEAARREAPASE